MLMVEKKIKKGEKSCNDKNTIDKIIVFLLNSKNVLLYLQKHPLY